MGAHSPATTHVEKNKYERGHNRTWSLALLAVAVAPLFATKSSIDSKPKCIRSSTMRNDVKRRVVSSLCVHHSDFATKIVHTNMTFVLCWVALWVALKERCLDASRGWIAASKYMVERSFRNKILCEWGVGRESKIRHFEPLSCHWRWQIPQFPCALCVGGYLRQGIYGGCSKGHLGNFRAWGVGHRALPDGGHIFSVSVR